MLKISCVNQQRCLFIYNKSNNNNNNKNFKKIKTYKNNNNEHSTIDVQDVQRAQNARAQRFRAHDPYLHLGRFIRLEGPLYTPYMLRLT